MNLVNIANGKIETDFSGEINMTGKVLVECVEGVCRQTQGYLKNDEKVYAFIGEEATEVVGKGLVGGESCSTRAIGKLLKSMDAVCINNGKSVNFENAEYKYVILEGVGVKDTPFEEEKSIQVIKRSQYYIIRDNFYTAGKFLIDIVFFFLYVVNKKK